MIGTTYVPLLRGKQYELMLLNTALPLIQRNPIVPVVEPVRANTDRLEKLIDYYVGFRAPLGVIINPAVGDFSEAALPLQLRVAEMLCLTPEVFPVVRLGTGGVEMHTLADAKALGVFEDGTPDRDTSSAVFNLVDQITFQICRTDQPSYQDYSMQSDRILLLDGFRRRRSIDYPMDEEFPSGPAYVRRNGYSGWGDFLIVGEEYQEGGGRPHAIAIHITYWGPEGELRVRHYLSDSNEGPEDPGGKFAEALAKLMADLAQSTCPIQETSAIRRLRRLHEIRHFPNLGPVKFLCMLHHIETITSRIGGESRDSSKLVPCQPKTGGRNDTPRSRRPDGPGGVPRCTPF